MTVRKGKSQALAPSTERQSMMMSIFAKSRFPALATPRLTWNLRGRSHSELQTQYSTFRAFEMRRAIWQSNEKLTKSLEYSRAESQTSGARSLQSRSRLLLNASYWRSISILVFEKKFIINLLLFLLPPSTKPVQLFADTQNSCWT